MFPSQGNTQVGLRPFTSTVDLTGKEGLLVILGNNAGAPVVSLPAALTDVPHFLLVDGDKAGQPVTAQPLTINENIRLRLKGACNPGDQLVIADPVAAAGVDAGKVRVQPAGAGAYVGIGKAEEVGVDGQLLLVRPHVRLVVVPTVVAPPAATAPVAGVFAAVHSTAVNPTKADFDALLAQCELLDGSVIALQATVAGLQTALVANGQVKSA